MQVAFQNSNSAAAQKDASNFANVVASNTAAVFASAPNLLSAGGLQTVSVRLQGRSIPVTTVRPMGGALLPQPTTIRFPLSLTYSVTQQNPVLSEIILSNVCLATKAVSHRDCNVMASAW